MRLLQASAICNQILNNLPVHQRFSAEKVYLKIYSAAGVGYQEIQRLLADFKAHQRSSAMIFALFCKAVLTGEVTVMGNVQAQCLDYSLALFEIADIFFIDVFCKQDIILRQLQNLLYRLTHLVVAVGQLLTGFHCRCHGIHIPNAAGNKLFRQRDYIINHIVYNMHAAAVDVHNDIIAVVLILVYHFPKSFRFSYSS